jgi:hypothetical protein
VSKQRLLIPVTSSLRATGAGIELLPVTLQDQIADAMAAVDQYNAFIETDQAEEKFTLTDAILDKTAPVAEKWGYVAREAKTVMSALRATMPGFD